MMWCGVKNKNKAKHNGWSSSPYPPAPDRHRSYYPHRHPAATLSLSLLLPLTHSQPSLTMIPEPTPLTDPEGYLALFKFNRRIRRCPRTGMSVTYADIGDPEGVPVLFVPPSGCSRWFAAPQGEYSASGQQCPWHTFPSEVHNCSMRSWMWGLSCECWERGSVEIKTRDKIAPTLEPRPGD